MAPLSRGGLVLAALPAGATAAGAQSPPSAWEPQTLPLFGASYSPDIGLLFGVGVIHSRYGLHALPPSMRLVAEAQYATEARSYRVDIAGQFRRRGPPTAFEITLRASGLELIRF